MKLTDFFTFNKISAAVAVLAGTAVAIVALPDITLTGNEELDALLMGALTALVGIFFPKDAAGNAC